MSAGHTLRNGFTLVELVMVLVILGIISVVALPRFFDGEAFDARGFYDELVAATRYAQKVAVASGCPVQVNITATGYSLSRQSGCTGGSFDTAVEHPARGGGFSGDAPGGVTLSAATITFAPLGNADSDAAINVGTRSFNVIGATGYVQSQ